MKEKKGLIIGFVICFIICFLLWKQNVGNQKFDYEGIVTSFTETFTDASKFNLFLRQHLDTKGAVIWQNVDGEMTEFLTMYSNIQNASEIRNQVFSSFADFRVGEDAKLRLVRIDGIQKDRNYPSFATVSSTVKVKEDGEDWTQGELVFTFYKGKIIDIESVNQDGSLSSLFSSLIDITIEEKVSANSERSIRTDGYYVYKTEESWQALEFLEDNEVRYLLNRCPGSACGGYIEYGTYQISGKEIIVTMTEYSADVEEGYFDVPEKYRFRLVSPDEITLDGDSFFYQDSFYE